MSGVLKLAEVLPMCKLENLNLANNQLCGLDSIGGCTYNAEGITTADVDMLLKVSDVNFSGHIERIELLPACITWKTMLANKEAPHQQSKKSSACTLL